MCGSGRLNEVIASPPRKQFRKRADDPLELIAIRLDTFAVLGGEGATSPELRTLFGRSYSAEPSGNLAFS